MHTLTLDHNIANLASTVPGSGRLGGSGNKKLSSRSGKVGAEEENSIGLFTETVFVCYPY